MVVIVKCRTGCFSVVFVLAILFSGCECKGGRSGGGGSRGGSRGSGGSHSSHTSSHSYGNSHTSYGSGYHNTYGGGYHPSHESSGSVSHTGGSKPIGFDHVNQQAHNSLNHGPGGRPGIGFDHVNAQAARPYHAYNPQTIRHPGGYVQYQPPSQLQYTPPVSTVYHSSTHYVPVYQPPVIHTQASGSDSGVHSFLGGYLVGRLTSGGHSHSYTPNQVTNNYYSDGSYYTVHHYHQNPEKVPSRFSVPGEDLSECEKNTADNLCVPNTNAFCLKNGTIMCTTPVVLTSPCEENSTAKCVYSRVRCSNTVPCNVTSNQTYIDFNLPCIANLTYMNNRVFDSNYVTTGSYELCVTAIAHPKKLESPFGALANLITEFGKWHMEKLRDLYNLTTPSNHVES